MKEDFSELEYRRFVKKFESQIERLENIARQRVGLMNSQNTQIYAASNCLLYKIRQDTDLFVKGELIDKTLDMYEKISGHIAQTNSHIEELIQSITT